MDTPTGQRLLAAADAALAAGDEFGAGSRLRAAGHPADLVAAAFGQAELRRRAAGAFTRAAEMLFTRAGLEQSTSEALARHRAARFVGVGRVADLCTGIGGDLLALTETGQPLVAVDRDPGHLRIAVHNAHVYAPAAEIDARCEDVRAADLTGVRAVFVDPARRSGARRFSPGASEPPLNWCLALAERVPAVAVKAAPGLPTELVPPGWEIEFVADGRDLKEAALYSPALTSGASRRATVLLAGGAEPASARALELAAQAAELVGPGAGLPGGAEPGQVREAEPGQVRGADNGRGVPAREVATGWRTATLAGEPDTADAEAHRVSDPGAFLYDPSPAVTRAGLVGTLGRQLAAWQIDPMIAFLTSDHPVETPFARLLRIETSLPFDVRRLAALLRTMGISALDLRRRGLAGDVDTLRRRLLPGRRELVPGGPAVTVVMTRHHDQPWAFVCTSR
ncbi:THUMP-like domain-containing protein [Pseudofrankia inefficax]|uniref:THUMP-like domain-containing protein n=1 Tax=Pseudofrankia inefficax (strain DSM 45817 / CECT 9037 / DDB 130130 / EuI1c) TaxID=298654 RepID=E3IZS8_PSEI1|nr:hypothetical protein FraEuI1c_6012 [Pseudofrankia inefficax]